jgi:hypothetical protein
MAGTVSTKDGQRIMPAGAPYQYTTFGFSQLSDRMDVLSCELVECDAWKHGWETTVDERTDLGMAQATYIRQKSGRTYREMKSGPLTVFRFQSRQRCFGEHRTRPQRFYQRGGDWRGTTSGPVLQGPDEWVERFAEHQARQAEDMQRG